MHSPLIIKWYTVNSGNVWAIADCKDDISLKGQWIGVRDCDAVWTSNVDNNSFVSVSVGLIFRNHKVRIAKRRRRSCPWHSARWKHDWDNGVFICPMLCSPYTSDGDWCCHCADRNSRTFLPLKKIPINKGNTSPRVKQRDSGLKGSSVSVSDTMPVAYFHPLNIQRRFLGWGLFLSQLPGVCWIWRMWAETWMKAWAEMWMKAWAEMWMKAWAEMRAETWAEIWVETWVEA